MRKIALLLVVAAVVCLSASTGYAQYEKGKSFLGPLFSVNINSRLASIISPGSFR
jgi:hypothetical protein